MLFNSIEFLIFLPMVVCVYFFLGPRKQNVFLLGASYFFYGWWDARFLSLLLLSTVVDYSVSIAIDRERSESRRRALLLISVCTNLGILGFFKYFSFFADSTQALLQAFGFSADFPTLNWILPMGISFYTFQTMAYTIDVYRRGSRPTKNLIDFGLYVAFFPQLVAGPIERARNLLPQISRRRTVSFSDVREGSTLILTGFVKKVAIADVIEPRVRHAFSFTSDIEPTALLIAVYLFSLQIYCDFSGYTDIARGTARILGFKLSENFTWPYFSRSITEFWRRWHISLSGWLRDYLYISLGGNRQGNRRTYINLFLTMALGGLWHGASWTFVLWGVLHGSYLFIERLYSKHPLRKSSPSRTPAFRPISGAIKMFMTFQIVSFTWVFFRAPSFILAIEYFKNILSGAMRWPATSEWLIAAYGFGLVLLIDVPQFIAKDSFVFSRRGPIISGLLTATALTLIAATWQAEHVPFIYFQF